MTLATSVLPRQNLISHPLDHLSYFTERGSHQWSHLLHNGFVEFLGTDLTGLRVLDIGTRYGKMACLFALLGANVTGIDIRADCLAIAREEAHKLGVDHKTNFIQYGGYLDIFQTHTFDIVFTKSVLVVVKDLDLYVRDIQRILRCGGKFVFLENGYGNCLLHTLRTLRHRSWNYTTARYFTRHEFGLIKQAFPLAMAKTCIIPPIWLIYGVNTC